jgi:Domain of unknown function (DUF4062)
VDKVYQVFVSSTYADLRDERRMVSETLAKAGHIPVGMELFPATDERQLEYIKRIIDRCDYYVVIVGGRYGSLADDTISYTEKEYEYALERKIPVLALLHGHPDKIEAGKTDKDRAQQERLELFRERLSHSRIIDHWTEPHELCTKIVIAVGNAINLSPGVGWIRGDQAIDPKVLQEMERIRIENGQLRTRLAELDSVPDRPIIYGGFALRTLNTAEDGTMLIRAGVTMANYGNAPGFIKYIEVGKGSLDAGLPSEPSYSERFDILDLYFPNMQLERVRPTRAWIEIPADGRHAVFQRVWYTDMSGNLHFSGSIYRLEVVTSGPGGAYIITDEPLLPDSAYWDWDRDNKTGRRDAITTIPAAGASDSPAA